MRLTTGTVVAGKIEPPGEILVEGATATVLLPDGPGLFHLGPEAEADLLAAAAEADRGELIPAEELLRELWHR